MKTIDLYCMIIELLLAAGLWVMADVAIRYESSRWRLLYLLPGLFVLLFLWMGDLEVSMLPVYGASLVMAVGFFREGKRVRRCSCIAGGALVLAGVIVCATNPGYRQPDYVKGFQEGFEGMKAHYCLTEHKGIDWDALYAKYLPKFEQADAHHDAAEDCMAWHLFAQEFYDGHVGFFAREETVIQEAEHRAFGKDYGLSLLCLADGRVVAVNVEKGGKAEEAGITNGCEITGWDGLPPAALTERVEYQAFVSPDQENEEFYKMLYVAGLGGDTVAVDYVDVRGEARQTVLPAIGDYCGRLLDTLDILDQGVNIGTLTWKEVSEDAVLFRVKAMSYDTMSYQNGDFSEFQKEMEEKLLQYRAEGKTKLIVDVRSNGGGNPYMILAMAELLGSEGEHFYCQYARLDEKTCEYVKDEVTGRYEVGGSLTYEGRNLWGHGDIILLVNGQCISAGDHFVRMMSEMPNVTIMGLTKSNASGQAVRYVETESGILTFSAVPALDENGDIYIDTGTDHSSKIPLDVKIPLDENAVRMIFDEGEDYVLRYALQY